MLNILCLCVGDAYGVLASSAAKKHSLLNPESVRLTTNRGKIVSLLKLPAGSKWLFLKSNILFVRDFYEDFFNEFIGRFAEDSKLIICGTPGIGKSVFGQYCIYRALQAGKTVVYHCEKCSDSFFIFKGDSVIEVSKRPRTLLTDLNTLYLVDSIKPSIVSCPTVLISCPQRDVWKDFSREEGCLQKWFGSWDRDDELDLLRQHCFPHVTLKLFNEQIIRWGKIPRATLTDNVHENSEDSLINLVSAHAEFLFKAAAIHHTEKDDTVHRLIHILPDSSFEDSSRGFASSHVADLVYGELERTAGDRLAVWLYDLDFLTCLSPIKAQMFERHARKIIQMGGTFWCRNIFNKLEVKTLTIPPLTRLCTSDFNTLEPTSNKILYSPVSVNEAAVDFIILDNHSLTAFNATIRNHTIIMDTADGKNELYRLFTALNLQSPSTCDYYFVVPESMASGFPVKVVTTLCKWNTSLSQKKEATLSRLSCEDKTRFQNRVGFFVMNIPLKRQLHTVTRLHQPKM